MRDSASKTTSRPQKLRLWHLSIVVWLSSVVFAGIRALTRGSGGSSTETLVGFAGVWVLASSSLVFISLGGKLGHRATRGLKAWGLARGGMIGFGVWLVGFVVNLVITLVFFAVGAALLVGLVQVLLRIAG